MNIRPYFLTLVLVALLPWPQAASASAIEASYRQARALVAQSIERMDAAAWLGQPAPFLVELRGEMDQSAEHLGPRSGKDAQAHYHETWAWDPASGVLGREYRQTHADGYEEWVREVFSNHDELWRFDIGTGSVLYYEGTELAIRRDRLLRRIAPVLLDEALEHGRALRFTGRFGPFDSVQMQTADNEALTLFFGRESGHLGWVEYLADLPSFGDSTVRWRLSDYRPVAGMGELPHRIGIDINNQPYSSLEVLRISRNSKEIDDFLALGEVPEPADAAPPAPRLERMGKGIFRIADVAPGIHMLAIEFDRTLMVIDAPATRPLLIELPASMAAHDPDRTPVSRRALAMLRQAFPGKPVQRLLLSHFHSDNAGGLMAFANQGVELLVSDTHAADVTAYLEHAHTLRRIEPRTATFEVNAITGRRNLGEGLPTVEVLKVGPNPHSDDMLATWIPESGILWVGDLQRSVSGRPDPSQQDLNLFFEQWLAQQGLSPRLVLTAHGDGTVDRAAVFRVDSEQTHHLPRDP